MMHLEVGSALDLSVEQGKIVLTPKKKDFSLEELLEGYTPADFAMDEEDREWHDMRPVGKEII